MAPYGSPQQQLAAWDCISFISVCYIVVSILVLFLEMVWNIEAPYGKFYNVSRKRASSFPLLNAIYLYPVPAKIAWLVQELPSFVVSIYFLSQSYLDPLIRESKLPIMNRIILGLFSFHYFNRTFIYSMKIRGGKPTAISAMFFAFVFTAINGYFQSLGLLMYYEYYIFIDDSNGYINFNCIRLFGGIFLWFTGFMINKQSDDILRNLRKPGEKGYKIPRGGMFEYITSAHYFGENIEWLGLGIATNGAPMYSFALFTFSNLFPRAVQSHNWYKTKFKGEYPKKRKVYIPFVY